MSRAHPQKWIILDRDGVINRDSSEYIKSPEEWVPIAGSIEAIAQLSQNNFTVMIATNQSGLARGLFDLEALTAMHRKMFGLLDTAGGKIAGIYYCPHGPDDNCSCRKPKSGLLEQMQKDSAIDFTNCDIVGDSIRDLQCGVTKGCQPFLVRTGKGKNSEEKLVQYPELRHTQIFDSLADYAHWRLRT